MFNGLGTSPLGLGGLYIEHGNKPTLKEVEDKVAEWLRDTDPGVVALVYYTINRSGVTLSDCPSRIAALKAKLRP